MARIIENDKGFKVIALNIEEAETLGFGMFAGICICMHCGNIIEDEIYYIAVLNDTMDKDCYESWLEGAKYYPEDAYYEDNNFIRIASQLNLL